MRIAAIFFLEVLIGCLVVWSVDATVPSRIGPYLEYCKKNLGACESEIVQVNLALTMEYIPGVQYCPPPRPDWATTEADVERWLFSHPRGDDELTPVAIRKVLLATNACHRR